ncbi:hypothetical protein ACJMK2_025055 [Sinanodonta woodiana]|uniref:Uncharacterized protein n=1 Tax=Sinanodonta woodiana TaxID=1069815 RepID=A0ABD3XH74_SINWO
MSSGHSTRRRIEGIKRRMDTNSIDDMDIAFDLQEKRLELIGCLQSYKKAMICIRNIQPSMRDLKVRYIIAQQEHNQTYNELCMLYCIRDSEKEDWYKYSETKYTRIMYLRLILYRDTAESERVVDYIKEQMHPGKDIIRHR